MTKLYAYLIAALLAVVGIGGLVWWGREGHQAAREALQKTKEVQTQLEASNEALRLYKQAQARNVQLSAKRDNVAQEQRARSQTRAKELHSAVQDNRDWADRPVPDSVWYAIGPGARASQAAPSAGATARVPGPAASPR